MQSNRYCLEFFPSLHYIRFLRTFIYFTSHVIFISQLSGFNSLFTLHVEEALIYLQPINLTTHA